MTKTITRPTPAELEEALLCLTKLGQTADGGVIVGPRGWEIVQGVIRRLKGPSPRRRKDGGDAG